MTETNLSNISSQSDSGAAQVQSHVIASSQKNEHPRANSPGQGMVHSQANSQTQTPADATGSVGKRSLKIKRIAEIKRPNQYIEMVHKEMKGWVLDEDTAPQYRGRWRKDLFNEMSSRPLDLEIGTGNGFFFAHRASTQPDRLLLGLEIKFKPLIQSVRRALNAGASNMRVARFHASLIEQLFEPQELNDVFIHFPDPWPKKKHHKNRLVQKGFPDALFRLQQPGATVHIKTDDRPYFDQIVEVFRNSPYEILAMSYDLHNSEWAAQNFETHFEKLWKSQGLKTHMLWVKKPTS